MKKPADRAGGNNTPNAAIGQKRKERFTAPLVPKSGSKRKKNRGGNKMREQKSLLKDFRKIEDVGSKKVDKKLSIAERERIYWRKKAGEEAEGR